LNYINIFSIGTTMKSKPLAVIMTISRMSNLENEMSSIRMLRFKKLWCSIIIFI